MRNRLKPILMMLIMMMSIIIIGVGGVTFAADNECITDWKIPANADGEGLGTTIKLPIPSNATNNYTVDYGDGTVTNYTTEAFPAHTYTNTSEMVYTIKITGTVDSFGYYEYSAPTDSNSYSDYYTFTQYLAKVKQLGELNATRYGFANCSQITRIGDENYTLLTNDTFQNVTSMMYMFLRCSNLTSVDLSNLRANNLTAMNHMFYGCSNLTSVDLSNLRANNLTTMKDMLYGCSNLVSVNLSNLNANNLSDMSYMFNNCLNLENVNFENFSASSVTDINRMFQYCKKIQSVDLSSFNATSVTDMSYMFQWCQELTSLNFGNNFDGSELTKMEYTFQNCEKLISLDLSSFNTTKLKSMRGTFDVCKSLKNINFGNNFDTSTVEDMTYAFYNCESLESIDVTGFDTSSVTSMYYMFYGCKTLKTLDLSSFDTSNIPYSSAIGSFIDYCTNLHSIKFGPMFNTKGDNYILNNVSALTSIILTEEIPVDYGFSNLYAYSMQNKTFYVPNNAVDTYRTAWTTGIFADGTKIQPLISIYGENPKYVQKGTTYVDEGSMVAGFSPSDSEYYTPYGLIATETYNEVNTNAVSIFPYHVGWSLGDGNIYNEIGTATREVYVEDKSEELIIDYKIPAGGAVAKLPIPQDGYNVFTVDWGDGTSNFCTPGDVFPSHTYSNTSETVYTIRILGTVKKFGYFLDTQPTTSNAYSNYYTFTQYLVKVKQLGNLNATRYGFSYCKNLTEFGDENYILATDDTFASVTDMSYMFNNCHGLTTLNVSNFNTSNVTNMGGMFNVCSGLTTLDLSNFNTSKVTDMSYMFNDCYGLKTLNLSNFNTSNVTNMSDMFNGCSGLTTLDLSNFNTSNVTNMSDMFFYCYRLTSLDVSNFNTSNVTNMSYMFYYCYRLTSLDVSNFNTSKVTTMYYMFYNCYGLTTLDVSNFNTSKVTNMNYMFYNCNKLRSLRLSDNFVIPSSNYSSMLSSTSQLTAIIIVGNLPTSNQFVNIVSQLNGKTFYVSNNFVTNYRAAWTSSYFADGTKVQPILSLIGENPKYVKVNDDYEELGSIVAGFTEADAQYYTPYGYTLTADLDTVDTSAERSEPYYMTYTLTNTDSAIEAETVTREVYVTESGINTKALIIDYKLPAGTIEAKLPIPQNSNNNFTVNWGDGTINTYGASSNFPAHTYTNASETTYTISVTGTVNTFGYYNNVEPSTSNAYSDYYTFARYLVKVKQLGELGASRYGFACCHNMTAMGDDEYTLVTDLTFENVTDMSYMFYNCTASGLKLDVSNFDTSNVTDMHSMFSNCSGLTTLDVSSFDTSNVTNMVYMFSNCSSLTTLDISNFDTSNVTNMHYMFSNCSGLTTLDVSSFNTSSVTDMIYMFYNCNKLRTLDLSNFDTRNVISWYSMLSDCKQLRSLCLSESFIILDTPLSMFDSALTSIIMLGDTPVANQFANIDSQLSGKTFYVPNNSVTDYRTAWTNSYFADGTKIQPILALAGDNPVYLAIGDSYTDDGATVAGFTEADAQYYTPYNYTLSQTLNDVDTSVGSNDPYHVTYELTNTEASIATETVTRDVYVRVPISGDVKITGKASYGETLTADTSEITPDDCTFTYQWYSNDVNSTDGGDAIESATNSTYTIGNGLIGKYIYVVVNATKDSSSVEFRDIIDATNNTTSTVARVNASDATITLPDGAIVYDGSEKKPVPTVVVNGKTLVAGTDYAVAYEDNTNAGTAKIIVTFKGNYTGTAEKEFTIEKADRNITLSEDDISVTYGTNVEVTVTFTGENSTVTASSDNVNVATANAVANGANSAVVTVASVGQGSATINITIAATDNYKSKTETLSVTVAQKDPELTVSPTSMNLIAQGSSATATYSYNGNGTVTVTSSNPSVAQVAKAGDTITVTPKIAGTATITITGAATEQYKEKSVTLAVTVDVTGLDIAFATIPTFEYDGNPKEIESPNKIIVKANGTTLTEGVDYTISYEDNTNAGTAKINITGIGGYVGSSGNITFNIAKAEGTASVTLNGWAYGETANAPEVISSTNDTGSVIVEYKVRGASDSTYTSVVPTDVGNYTVRVTLAESQNYNAVVEEYDFSISKRDINNATVSLGTLLSYEYDGTEKKPSVTVTDSASITTDDYDVTYSENVNAGTAFVRVKGKGNYTGTKTITFEITKKPITVTPIAASKIFGENDPDKFNYTVTGYVGVAPTLVGKLGREEGENVGEYDIEKGTLTVLGNNNYDINVVSGIKFTISAKSINSFDISVLLSETVFVYDGTAKTPSVALRDGINALTLDSDYHVEYSDNIDKGIAEVDITGLGNYEGTRTASFMISGDGNYGGMGEGEFDINKANSTIPTITGFSVVYDKLAHELSVEGGEGGTICYRTSTDDISWGEWSETKPSLTDVDRLYVQAYVRGDNNHNSSIHTDSVVIEVTQAEGTGSVTLEGWMSGDEPNTPVLVSETNGIENVTIDYLVEGEYTSEVPERAGSYVVRATFAATRNYKQVVASSSFVIESRPIVDFDITVNEDSIVYDGTEKKPSVTVKVDGHEVVEGTDYTVRYEDNIEAGTAKVIITGIVDYRGSTGETTFEISRKEVTVTPIAANKGHGEADPAKFEYIISGYIGGTAPVIVGRLEREEGEDVGEYEIVKGSLELDSSETNYTLKVAPGVKFTINATSIDGWAITVDLLEGCVYDGTPQEPGVVVSDGTTVDPSNYEVTYENNVDAGTATVKVTGIGNFTGTKTATFEIGQRPLKIKPEEGLYKIYGYADPDIHFTYEGNVDGEEPKFLGKLTREPGENVGFYKYKIGDLRIIDNGSFKASNYRIEL